MRPSGGGRDVGPLNFRRNSIWRSVLEAYSKRRGGCVEDFRGILGDRQVVLDEKIGAYLDSEQDSLVLRIYPRLDQLKGRKPVIYVWAPCPQKVSVRLTLARQWEFSALYPIAPITPFKLAAGTGQTTAWNVLTRKDGSLVDEFTGLETTYLFWEALYVLFVPTVAAYQCF